MCPRSFLTVRWFITGDCTVFFHLVPSNICTDTNIVLEKQLLGIFNYMYLGQKAPQCYSPLTFDPRVRHAGHFIYHIAWPIGYVPASRAPLLVPYVCHKRWTECDERLDGISRICSWCALREKSSPEGLCVLSEKNRNKKLNRVMFCT